jgi:hypothetical protein
VGEERREGKKKQETTKRRGRKVPNFENKSENQKIRWKKKKMPESRIPSPLTHEPSPPTSESDDWVLITF